MNGHEARLLLRLYPPAWRERYGGELEALLGELGQGEGISWATRLDVISAGLGERFRALGLGPATAPRVRARSGALLVLCAWLLFALAGVRVQKFSEHWQGATPPLQRGLSAAAFHVLEVAAGIGGALVLLGIALALPRAFAYVRSGGWLFIRRAVVGTFALTSLAICAAAAVGVWAHHLDAAQRNGGDSAYGWAFVACALLLAASLASWTALAIAIARRMQISDRLLRIEASLAGAVGASMLAMTLATTAWWGTLARVAPWVLHGRPAGSPSSSFTFTLFLPSAAMAAATCLAGFGSLTALSATRQLGDRPVV